MTGTLSGFLSGPEALGPDEEVYRTQAQTIRRRGLIRGFRVLADRYLAHPDASHYPAPTRWLWVVVVAVTIRWGQRTPSLTAGMALPFVAAWAFRFDWAALLAASSPLLWICGRRCLQDTTVAVVAVATLGFAIRGDPFFMGCGLFTLLSLKEAGALYVPGVALAAVGSGMGPIAVTVATVAASTAWLATTRAIVGRDSWRVLRLSRRGHDTEYTARNQAGGPQRLLVDFAVLSPLPLILGSVSAYQNLTLAAAAIIIVLCHGASPIQNARTILAIDVVVRGMVVCWLWSVAPLALIPLLAFDAITASRTRDIYDPVTAELQRATGIQTS